MPFSSHLCLSVQLSVLTRLSRQEISAFGVGPGGPASPPQLRLPHFASQHRAKVGECPSSPSVNRIHHKPPPQVCNRPDPTAVQAEDDAPPRPPLPRLYDYEETPPVVPPLPKEASVIRHTSVRGLKRQSDERKRDREGGQYIANGDCKVSSFIFPKVGSLLHIVCSCRYDTVNLCRVIEMLR